MADSTSRFAPKVTVKLDPPQDKLFSIEELAKYDGVQNEKIYVAVKGTVFDVTRNKASYGPEAGYHVFAGKDASRALARTSLEPNDVKPEYEDLPTSDLQVLDDWYSFFSLRYNVVGKVEGHEHAGN